MLGEPLCVSPGAMLIGILWFLLLVTFRIFVGCGSCWKLALASHGLVGK